jgi:hypothetical protein
MTPIKLRLAMASMGRPETKVVPAYLPDGQLQADGVKLLKLG